MKKITFLFAILFAGGLNNSRAQGTCPAPSNLRVPNISDTCVRLNWDVPDTLVVEHIKIDYRVLGDPTWIEERKKAGENDIMLCGLTPGTTYEWRVRNICAADNTDWLSGPNFTTSGTLPLKFISFSAALQKTSAVLHWQTADEINTSYFNIQRCFNGTGFITVAKQNAAGNSNITQQYNYTDANVTGLQQPTIYYRLQSVDRDGRSAYSGTVALKINNSNISSAPFLLYPNPAKDKLHISLNGAENTVLSLRVVDMHGRQVHTEKLTVTPGSLEHTIDISNLARGIYTIQLISDKGTSNCSFAKE